MNREEKIQAFLAWEKKITARQMALTIIGVDAVDVPPRRGSAWRNAQTSELYGELFALKNDKAMYDIRGELLKEKDLDFPLRRRLEIFQKEADRLKNVPQDFYRTYQTILSESEEAWLRAKADNDYASYAPLLKKLIQAHSDLISMRDSPLSLYDRMLDDHEPGLTAKKCDAFFDACKKTLLPLIHRISPIETPVFAKDYPIDRQRQFMITVLAYVGFTDDWGKMTESEHPVTTGICKNDVRFTNHFRLHNPADAVLSAVHETGHAWYIHNIDPAFDGTVLLTEIPASMHESQSRFCENCLGRSEAFWSVIYPKLQDTFPENLRDVTETDFLKQVNAVRPSLIRTLADEVTYPIHIAIRYELERDLFAGKLSVNDLEDAWNSLYKEYLGVDVPDPARGILQDMHWPYAYFGYFPAYALGSAYASQFYHAMCKDIDPDALLRESRYTDITAWLGEHIQKYGCLYDPEDILKMSTGEAFNPAYYLNDLKARCASSL